MSKNYKFEVPIEGTAVILIEAENLEDALEQLEEKPAPFSSEVFGLDYDRAILVGVE